MTREKILKAINHDGHVGIVEGDELTLWFDAPIHATVSRSGNELFLKFEGGVSSGKLEEFIDQLQVINVGLKNADVEEF